MTLKMRKYALICIWFYLQVKQGRNQEFLPGGPSIVLK